MRAAGLALLILGAVLAAAIIAAMIWVRRTAGADAGDLLLLGAVTALAVLAASFGIVLVAAARRRRQAR